MRYVLPMTPRSLTVPSRARVSCLEHHLGDPCAPGQVDMAFRLRGARCTPKKRGLGAAYSAAPFRRQGSGKVSLRAFETSPCKIWKTSLAVYCPPKAGLRASCRPELRSMSSSGGKRAQCRPWRSRQWMAEFRPIPANADYRGSNSPTPKGCPVTGNSPSIGSTCSSLPSFLRHSPKGT